MTQELNEQINHAVDILYSVCEGKTLDHKTLCDKANLIVNTFSECALLKDNVEDIVNRYESKNGIRTFVSGETVVANKNANDSWLFKRKNEVSHEYAQRYMKFLLTSKEGGRLGEQVVDYIMSEAETILSYCADPSIHSKKLGLVMGDVQSGKTANYLALANMACDYGYKVVLILSGITETLRRQTQQRVDEGVTGAISSTIIANNIEYTDIGRYSEKPAYYAIPLTTDLDDFSPLNCTSQDLNKPQILVVKKNKNILEGVRDWLKPGQDVASENILIIDDECDNASVNTSKDYSPTTINRLIREIYNNFPSATYVGYTATPFANIFINPDSEKSNLDLFPRDFIHRLITKDEQYFGITKVFAENSRYIELLDEDEPFSIPSIHKKDFEIYQLPESLKDAVCSFLICNCIRTLRGDVHAHRSMMINVSRFNAVQFRIENRVNDYIKLLSNCIPHYDRRGINYFLQNTEMERIYNIFTNDDMFQDAREEFSFEDIMNLLNSEVKQFVVAVYNNSVKKEDLFNYNDYEVQGARVIIIGGLSLSRGLTLYGLMISYYNRHAEAYDTLLQMCRWFGYRRNYEDLCKIYMTEINLDCFGVVIDAINNLDEQLSDMAAVGDVPEHYGLMIKKCPDFLETKLFITALNKSRHSHELEWVMNFSAAVVDTPKLYKDIEKIKKNDREVRLLVKNLTKLGYKIEHDNQTNRYFFKNVSKDIVADFVNNLVLPPENRKFNVSCIVDFINEGRYYDKWDIAFATGDENEDNVIYMLEDANGNVCLSIPPSQRSFSTEPEDELISFFRRNNRLTGPLIFNAGLSAEQLKEAEEIKRAREESKGISSSQYAPTDFLKVKNRNPLLVIMPLYLKPNKNSKIDETSEHKLEVINSIKEAGSFLIGFAIGFPSNDGDNVEYTYRINEIKLKELENRLEDEEDEGDDEYEN